MRFVRTEDGLKVFDSETAKKHAEYIKDHRRRLRELERIQYGFDSPWDGDY